MPLRPIEFVGRGNNSLLNSLLSGATVSLSRALSDGVQQTRDAASNQLVQERNFFGERRFDREFREEQFRDRRNFGRRVFTEDRAFGENVRQFNVTAEDRDLDRGLRAELGRGQLGIARDRLALAREQNELAAREGELRLDILEEDRDYKLETREQIDSLRERERIANDPEAFAASIQDPFDPLSEDEIEERRARELNQIGREYDFFQRPRVAEANFLNEQRVGVLPPITPRDAAAEQTMIEADTNLAEGDYAGAVEKLTRAQAEALPGSPTFRQIEATLNIAKAQRAAFAEGTSISTEAAAAAVETFQNYRNSAFPNRTIEDEIRLVNESLTKEEYIAAVDPDTIKRDETPSQKDTRAKRRAEFYDAIKSSSPRDIQRRQAEDDPYAAELRDLITE